MRGHQLEYVYAPHTQHAELREESAVSDALAIGHSETQMIGAAEPAVVVRRGVLAVAPKTRMAK